MTVNTLQHICPSASTVCGEPKGTRNDVCLWGPCIPLCQSALLFSRSLGQGRVSAFLKTVPWGEGGRLQVRFGVFLTLVSELGVYSMLSPLEETIRLPEWGEDMELGGADLGKLDKESWLIRYRRHCGSLIANSSWEEGLSNLIQFRLKSLRASGLIICSCIF